MVLSSQNASVFLSGCFSFFSCEIHPQKCWEKGRHTVLEIKFRPLHIPLNHIPDSLRSFCPASLNALRCLDALLSSRSVPTSSPLLLGWLEVGESAGEGRKEGSTQESPSHCHVPLCSAIQPKQRKKGIVSRSGYFSGVTDGNNPTHCTSPCSHLPVQMFHSNKMRGFQGMDIITSRNQGLSPSSIKK